MNDDEEVVEAGEDGEEGEEIGDVIPRQRNVGGRPPKVGAGKRAKGAVAPDKFRIPWKSTQLHTRWAELCEYLVEGPAEYRAALYAQPGAGPEDVELMLERVDPPGSGALPRIPGSAIYRAGQSSADLCYLYIVNNYHRLYRGGGAAKYWGTFFWRSTNRQYLTRCQLELDPYETIYEIMQAQQATGVIVPSMSSTRDLGGLGGRQLPPTIGAGGFNPGGYNPSEERLLRMIEERDKKKDELIKELWAKVHPDQPLPAGVGAAAMAPASASPLSPPSPLTIDADAIAAATTRSVMGILAEMGIAPSMRAPVGAPTSINGEAPRSAAVGSGLNGSFAAQAAIPPRIAALHRKIEETREELILRQELAELRDEFDPSGSEDGTPAATGAGAAPASEEKAKPPYELTEIPGPKLYDKPVYTMKEHEPAGSFGESLQRWALRAPGLTEAVGAGIGRFIEGAGGAAVARMTTAAAGFVDRMGTPLAGAASGSGRTPEIAEQRDRDRDRDRDRVEHRAQVVDAIPHGAQSAQAVQEEPSAPPAAKVDPWSNVVG